MSRETAWARSSALDALRLAHLRQHWHQDSTRDRKWRSQMSDVPDDLALMPPLGVTPPSA